MTADTVPCPDSQPPRMSEGDARALAANCVKEAEARGFNSNLSADSKRILIKEIADLLHVVVADYGNR